jgi:hypothetical protein
MEEFPKPTPANQNEKIPQDVAALLADIEKELKEVRAFMAEKYATIEARSTGTQEPALSEADAREALQLLSYLGLSLKTSELTGHFLLGQPKSRDAGINGRALYNNLVERHRDAKKTLARLNI